MTKRFNLLLLAGFVLFVAAILSGCASDANVASQNLSRDADMFRVARRIVFYNGITDEYMLTIEGLCSINSDNVDRQLEVTCKTDHDRYKKHFLGLSDNVTYFAEQLDSYGVNVYHYTVIFKPESIIPNIDIETSVSQ